MADLSQLAQLATDPATLVAAIPTVIGSFMGALTAAALARRKEWMKAATRVARKVARLELKRHRDECPGATKRETTSEAAA